MCKNTKAARNRKIKHITDRKLIEKVEKIIDLKKSY